LCCVERALPARRILPVARQRFEDGVGIGEKRPQALNDQTFEIDRWQALARVAADFPVRNFDPKAVAVLTEAFDGVVAELALQAPAERARAAKLIIRLALG
jgi:hypothetical protein